MTTENDKLYSTSYLTENISSDEEIIHDFIELFLENTPNDLKSLNMAFEEKDIEQISAAAHKMKSSLDVMKISALYDEIRKIDKPFKTETLTNELPEIIANINNVLEKVFDQMKNDFSC